jgi:predicted GNAT superfamily acetyltransferase
VTSEPWLAADAAAASAGVTVRVLNHIGDLEAVRRLYEAVWHTGARNPPVTADLLKALAKAGSYVSGAYVGDVLVGACFGFFTAPEHDALHSHITGVLRDARASHVGFALKLHQRAWTLDAGAAAVTWTFDPLIRRNAWFNLSKLAADVVEYLPDFYGPLDDDINRKDPTDRLLVRWALRTPAVVEACAGHPRETKSVASEQVVTVLEESASGGFIRRKPTSGVVRLGVPADVEELRERDPGCAADWRRAVREVLGGLLASGARVRGFDRDGAYVVERSDA